MALRHEQLGILALLTALSVGCDVKDDGSDVGDDDALVEDGEAAATGGEEAATGGEDDDEDAQTTGEVPGDDDDEPASTTTAGGDPEPEPEAEACAEPGASRSCDGGVQYCDNMGFDGPLEWGPCLASTACEVGETEHCGFCPGEDVDGDPEEACPGFGNTCELIDGVPSMPDELDSECNTPLVLSFDGAPVDMGPAPAHTFDINDTDASCTTTDWPAATTPWLALDLDRSGTIESGRELFGSGTRLADGRRASNGFAALEALDDNRDGRIDATDSRFAELVLWADHDADKTATLAELTPVAMRGILSIDLGYTVSPRCDDRGNCEMQRAAFKYVDRGGEVRDGEIIDIYLSCQ